MASVGSSISIVNVFQRSRHRSGLSKLSSFTPKVFRTRGIALAGIGSPRRTVFATESLLPVANILRRAPSGYAWVTPITVVLDLANAVHVIVGSHADPLVLS